jgi:V/A-type H+-transporting ATPase subunit D
MPAHNVAPTKSNLLREKERLALAEEGYELLERKREILMLELMRKIAELRDLERRLHEAASHAYPMLRRYLMAGGIGTAREAAAGIRPDCSLVERRVQIAGISIPVLDVVPVQRGLQVGPLDSTVDSDELSRRFSDIMHKLVDIASLYSVVLTLAREVRKIQRRVNALEKLIIPRSKEVSRFIESSLEEREREAVFSTKRLKARALRDRVKRVK